MVLKEPIIRSFEPSIIEVADNFISVGALLSAAVLTFAASLKSIEPEPGVAFSAIAAFLT